VSRGSSIRTGQTRAGWAFVSPTLVVLGLFLAVPILMALWVSFTDWNGRGSPFASGIGFVGVDNYRELVGEQGGLTRSDFMTSLRNNFFYVLLVVPLQTAFALFLALVLNQRLLKGVGFFRTAFYFPSVVSSVAISLVFLFLFSGTGVINTLLDAIGIDGPTWFNDSRGLLHLLGDGLGLWNASAPPSGLTGGGVLGLTWWDWLAGPSVALSVIIMLVIWTTAGTFMLMFLAALQDLPLEVEEAARIDGANTLGIIWYVVIPLAKPALGAAALLAFLSAWDEFFYALIFTSDLRAKTLPVAIADFAAGRATDYGLVSAVGVLAALPPTIFAVLFQRSLVSGLSAGSVKG
jgi:multiple sugar transport system permease protein